MMDEQQLTQEFHLLNDSGLVRTDRCADEYVLAAIAAGTMSGEERDRLILHLSTCDYCLAHISELLRVGDSAAFAPVSELLLARAARGSASLVRGAPKVATPVRVWAAAAVLILAVTLLLEHPWNVPAPTGVTGDAAGIEAESAVRRIDPDAMMPRITFPAAGLAIDPHGATVRWTPVSGSLYYDVQVLGDSGEVLWQQRVDENTAVLPSSLVLEPGREYFLRVDAYLAEARSISSHHVVFSVRSPDSGDHR